MKNKIKKDNIIPFMIEKNMGQHKNESKFVLRNNKGNVYFLQSEIIFALMKNKEDEKSDNNIDIKQNKNVKAKEFEVNFINMKLKNSNKQSEIEGIGEFECKINYFKGKDESQWTTNIPVYEKVLYKEIYPNIDLVYYENQGTLEHDFIVKPEGNIENIKMVFEGADKIEKDEDGNLLISTKDNTLQMVKPKVYQNIKDKKIDIESSFIIEEDTVKFHIPKYNKREILVIDPQLLYGSYLGGNNVDYGKGIAVDNNQNAYITGYTESSSDFPLKNAYQETYAGNGDAFLIKIDTKLSGSSSLLYGSYIGGSGYDEGSGIAVDYAQNAYITGYTSSSSDFPLKNAYQKSLNGSQNAFLIKIDTKLKGESGLKYGSYIGGSNEDEGNGVAVDYAQNAYIAGYTSSSSDFPLKNAYQKSLNGSQNAFLIKIDTKLKGESSLKYGSYIGGCDEDEGNGVAVDYAQNAYITGYTQSNDFPVKNPYQERLGAHGAVNTFLVKIDTKLKGESGLKYGSYIGGGYSDKGYGIAVDNFQNAYITGQAFSSDFPVKNAYQNKLKGHYNAFLIKIDTKLRGKCSLKYGSYIGGSFIDQGYGIAVDNFQNAYITGFTKSSDFPVKNAYQEKIGGVDADNVFLIKIDTKLRGKNSLKYGSYIGGDGSYDGYGIAVDNFQNAYITGQAFSSDFPVKNAYQENLNGNSEAFNSDAFLVKLRTKPSCSDLLLNQSLCNPIYDWNFQTKGEVWYKIKITNKGPDTATNLIMTDFIDKNMEILSAHSAVGTIEQRENTAYWQIDKLEVGQTVECKIKVKSKTPMISKYVKNIASVKSDNVAANLKNTIDAIIVYIRNF